jgi:hypothetical protein
MCNVLGNTSRVVWISDRYAVLNFFIGVVEFFNFLMEVRSFYQQNHSKVYIFCNGVDIKSQYF